MLSKIKQNIDIILLIIISSFFNIWNLWGQGLGNLYYSAGVSSMRQSFHAFFYNSLDVSGYISIDKPPLGLWIQVLSTKIFGFNGLAILLPEAICGVLSVFFLYRMITKRFGKLAGFLSGIILSITPIFVAVARNNTIDSILILLLILASEQTIKATQTKNFRNILFAGIFLGLGFNVKMLQAYMIVPAVYLTYLLYSNVKMGKRILYTFLSGIIAIIISFSWIMAVDLTPIEKRPFVGSSTTNSELELVFGYNGVGRLFGIGMGQQKGNKNVMPQNGNNNQMLPPPMENNDNDNPQTDENQFKKQVPPEINSNERPDFPPNMDSDEKNMPPMQKQNNGGKNMGGEAGSTSLFRFFNNSISGQISWFIIPSFLCVIAFIYIFFKKKTQRKSENNALLFFLSICFVSMFIYFSFSSGVAHRYYLAMIAPSISALSGILFSELIKNKKTLWFISILSISVLSQIYIQNLYKEWFNTIIYFVLILYILAIIIVILTRDNKFSNRIKTISLVVLIILPTVWSLSPILYGDNSQIPITGPELKNSKNAFSQETDMSEIIAYLKNNKGDAKYLALVNSAMDGGNELILESSEPIMTIGGFSGGDNSINLNELKEKISNGVVRYAVLKGNKQMQIQGKNIFNTDEKNKEDQDITEIDDNITEWIKENCEDVLQDDSGYSVYDLSSYK